MEPKLKATLLPARKLKAPKAKAIRPVIILIVIRPSPPKSNPKAPVMPGL
jgi:hypothetical protein